MSIPHDFMMEFLYPLAIRTKSMFGNVALYHEEKILLATRKKIDNTTDNGIWIAAPLDYQDKLKEQIPELRPIQMISTKKWLLLHEEEELFEERAQLIAELIKSNSPLIGTVPKPKDKK